MAGVDLIRRKEGKTAYAFTIPLITDAQGRKFGKSEGNAVWLDPEKTSPFRFYQFWLNQDDESVERYLKIFTDLSLGDIAELMRTHEENRGERAAQRTLAREVTALVHGADTAAQAESAAQALFGDGEVTAATANMLKNDAPSCAVAVGTSVLDALVTSGLASSKREARQFVADGAVVLNGEKISEDRPLTDTDFTHGIAILKRGKKNATVLMVA
jgi:tyrosyl-tRNA synthetase